MTRTTAILSFTIGYVGMLLLMIGAGWLLLMPVGYGYIGAELVAGWLLWSTAYNWEILNLQLAVMLEEHGY